MNKHITISIILLFLISPLKSFSQNNSIKGIVIDKITNKTLPFVSIAYNNKNEGVNSNIDGSFEITFTNKVEFLKFSFVGYKTKLININEIEKNKVLKIELQQKDIDIEEVTILPGENPAHRIIKKTVANRKINNPENLNSYSYKSYNKFVYTYDIESSLKNAQKKNLNIDSLMQDSSYIKTKNTLDSMFLLMTESITERKYKKPGKIHEKIIANKVSGFKDASLFVLSTQLQSLSFYNQMITIAEGRYINPISKGSTRKYFFNIEDTTYNKRGDTIFVISYKPRKNKNFEGLKGVLNINTYKYAIESVIAEPVNKEGLLDIKIKQKYTLINNEHWFPTELDTRIIFKNIQKQSKDLYFETLAISKGYISDIQINKEISNKEFGLIELELAEDINKKDSVFWNKNRPEKLNKKELHTYHIVDSIGEKHNFDLKMDIIETITKGYIPIKFIDIAINSLLAYNLFEGLRLGVGVQTNDKISSFFSIGGYFAYGFLDKKSKYGGSINFNIYKKRGIKLGFLYKNDVIASSGYNFLEPSVFTTTEIARKDMTYVTQYAARLQSIPFKHFRFNISAARQTMYNPTDYENIRPTFPVFENYNFFETAFRFRFAPKEQLTYINNEFFPVTNITAPIFMGNIIKGFNNFNGNYDYLKLEAKINLNFLTKTFGKTNLQFVGGKVWGELPYFKLYNGHGTYYNFNIEEPNSFATMRMNEFLSDQFFAVYLRQDFGSLLYKTKKFKPQIFLVSSVIYGTLNNINYHFNIPIQTLEKGYFESGILINSIARWKEFLGFGVGVFYRYGDYAFDSIEDNFAYRLTLTLNL